jgi:hypothetical protein
MDFGHDERFVWIFARPLTIGGALLSSVVASTSAGRYPLCHWGVLVTGVSRNLIRDLPVGTRDTTDLELGKMWELQPRSGENTVVIRPFNASILSEEWRHHSAQYVGATTLTDEQINIEGT